MHRKLLFNLFSLSLILGLLMSCRKAATEVPFYLKCDSAAISPSTLGISNPGIYALYVSVEGDVRGTWQMPFKMPILGNGLKSLYVEPIIKINNLSTRFIAYPLLKPLQVNTEVVPDKTLDTFLSFEYASDVNLIVNEEMEVNTNFTVSTKSVNARNGNGSMFMTANFSSIDSSATSFYYKQLPFNFDKTTFLEFDYYMPEGILAPALAYNDGSGNTRVMFGESYLNKNTGWSHVYYNYTYIIDRIGKSGLYTPVFILTMPKGFTTANVYIDNFRILEK